jgi:hypothetical protein
MPNTQTAAVSNYDFGAPVTKAQVGLFQILRGARVALRFENEAQVDCTIWLLVASTLNGTYSFTTAGNNVNAVSAAVIQAGTVLDTNILLRAGIDNYLQLQAASATGSRFNMQERVAGGVAGGTCISPLNWNIGTTAPIQTPTSATV